ncbi:MULTISPECIES: hypothetical protein [Aeromonas]|uniref:hypothetical protein n=1 Tax=Aeromonas TaxID=642 RepID=UPI002B05E316|nr:hypothetical protein [Aeromonas jandaei]
MLGKNDVYPMLLNIALIVGGVVLVCVAGTLPEASLREHVADTASGAALFVTLVVQLLILLPVGKFIFNSYKENKKSLCLCIGFFGVGLVVFSQFVLLPFMDQLYSLVGNVFIEYVKNISNFVY